MCDSDSRDYNREVAQQTPFVRLPCVRIEMPLARMNEMYVQVTDAQRVLREGNPEKKVALAEAILAQLGMSMDEASGGFLAARN